MDPHERLTYLLNEAAESKLVRVVQLYQFNRLLKLLRDPRHILEIQANNPQAKLLEDNEALLAQKWLKYIEEHDIELEDVPDEYALISLAAQSTTWTEFKRLIDPDLIDYPSVEALLQQVRRLTDGPQSAADDSSAAGGGSLPSNLSICCTSETFRPGLYKGKVHARL